MQARRSAEGLAAQRRLYGEGSPGGRGLKRLCAQKYCSGISRTRSSMNAFMRRTSIVALDGLAARQLAPHVAAIAEAEGLPVHGESAMARIEDEQHG